MTFSVPGYRVDHLLGRGSHGEVWSGRAHNSGELVALKRIVTTDRDVMASAHAEAAVLAGLDHPSLLQLRDFVVTEGAVVLVLELADGGSLAQLLTRRDRLSPGEVASTLSPVGAALAHAHSEGLLHGDVSAANVLFSASGHAKLADFGIARMIGGDTDVIGTPAYLDPVIAAGGVPGAASDVFSAGAVALHCLTGAGPWHSGGVDSVAEVLAAAATGSIADLPARLSHCPPEMAAVLTRALDPEPYRRGTAAEFALDLRASTRPVPVMLTGGRVAPKAGRHSLESRQLEAVPRRTEPTSHVTEAPRARPTSSRPAHIAAGLPPAELTHVSRPQLRPPMAMAAARRRWLPAALAGRSGWLGFGAVVIGGLTVLAVAAAMVLLPRQAASVSTSRPAPPSTLGAPHTANGVARALADPVATAAPPSRATTTAGSVATGSAPVGVDVAVRVAAILTELDTSRAQAFQLRRPELLKRVYGVPGLLAQDAAQLNQVVPPGCGATGLRTRYRVLSAEQQPGSASTAVLDASVTASLPAGSVVCAGSVRRRTSAAGPVTLRLTLQREGSGYRIISQRIVH